MRETTTEAAEASTTTTAEATTTTTTAEVERPTLATTGEDLVAVFASLQAYTSTLFTDPDPTLLGDVVVAGTPYYDELHERITTLADNGYPIEAGDTAYSEVQVTTRPARSKSAARRRGARRARTTTGPAWSPRSIRSSSRCRCSCGSGSRSSSTSRLRG